MLWLAKVLPLFSLLCTTVMCSLMKSTRQSVALTPGAVTTSSPASRLMRTVSLGAAPVRPDGLPNASNNHLWHIDPALATNGVIIVALASRHFRAGKRVFPLASAPVDQIIPVIHMPFERHHIRALSQLAEISLRWRAGIAAL